MIDGYIGFVNKVEVDQVQDDEYQQYNAGIRHGGGTDGSAARPFVDDIAAGSGLEVLIKKGEAGTDVYDGENQQPPFHERDQRTEGMEVFGI